MRVGRVCPKLVLSGTQSQAKCWKGNWRDPRGVGRQGQEALEWSMVNLPFLVGIHQMKLQSSEGPLRTSPMDTFRYKNYIIITIFSLFRWQNSSKTPLLQRQQNTKVLSDPGQVSISSKWLPNNSALEGCSLVELQVTRLLQSRVCPCRPLWGLCSLVV